MKYKIVMLAYIGNDIVIERDLTLEEAQTKLKEYEKEDSIHYYEIKREN